MKFHIKRPRTENVYALAVALSIAVLLVAIYMEMLERAARG